MRLKFKNATSAIGSFSLGRRGSIRASRDGDLFGYKVKLEEFHRTLEGSRAVVESMDNEFENLVQAIEQVGALGDAWLQKKGQKNDPPVTFDALCRRLIRHLMDRYTTSPPLVIASGFRVLRRLLERTKEHRSKSASPSSSAASASSSSSSSSSAPPPASSSAASSSASSSAAAGGGDGGGDASDNLFEMAQQDMCLRGGATLLVHLLAVPPHEFDQEVCDEVLAYGVVLLEDGNSIVQNHIHAALSGGSPKASAFFAAAQARMKLSAEHMKLARRTAKGVAGNSGGSAGGDPSLRSDPLNLCGLLRLLQLCCEGHYLPMQDLMRTQPTLSKSADLLREVVDLLQVTVKDEYTVRQLTKDKLPLLIQCLDFLVEAVQGPCLLNQSRLSATGMVHLCKMLISVQVSNRMRYQVEVEATGKSGVCGGCCRGASARTKTGAAAGAGASAKGAAAGGGLDGGEGDPSGRFAWVDNDDIKQVKSKAVKALSSLLEGRGDRVIHRSLEENLDFQALRRRLVTIYREFGLLKKLNDHDDSWDEEFLEEGFDLLNVGNALSMLKAEPLGPRPSARRHGVGEDEHAAELRAWKAKHEYKVAHEFFTGGMASVEVFWGSGEHQQLDKVLFPLPSDCRFLTEEAKGAFLSNVDISTPEDSKKDFITRSLKLADEMAHYQTLRYGFVRGGGRGKGGGGFHSVALSPKVYCGTHIAPYAVF